MFPFLNLSSHYVVGIRLFYLAPVTKQGSMGYYPITIQLLKPIVNLGENKI